MPLRPRNSACSLLAGLVAILVLCPAGSAQAVPRDVQIRSIDFETSVVELHNFGSTTEDLAGWRLCTHDEDQIRVYSLPAGFTGLTIAGGASLFLHFANDAVAGDEVDISSIGSVATPLDRGAYGFGLYINGNFTSGLAIADHVQWSIDGIDDTSADERSDEAVSGGVWTDESAWVATAVDTARLVLKTASEGLVLHGPADYEMVPEPGAPLATAATLLTLAALRRRRRS